MEHEDLLFLPISVNVTDKKILLVGGGKVATHKAKILARFVRNVTVVAPAFTKEIQEQPFTFVEKAYEPGDLDGFFLVYVCTGDHGLNQQIHDDAAKAGILASVCDNPVLCDFISPAIHQVEYISIAVSSNARNVRHSVAIRNQIAQLIENDTIHIP
jgi:precorrin-2 dehydrogenase / sirohydrochlorin ferrochelatase